MRISSLFLVVLVLSVAVVMVPDSEAYSSDPPEGLDDFVLVESYKKVSSLHIVVSQTTKSAYPFVVVYAFTGLPVTVSVNGSEISSFVPSGDGSKLLLHFDEGDKIDLRVSVGSVNYDYSFTVMKTISIKELDPEEDPSELPIYDLGELVIFCVIVFIFGAAGVYGMFRFYKRRALMEVRPLGKE